MGYYHTFLVQFSCQLIFDFIYFISFIPIESTTTPVSTTTTSTKTTTTSSKTTSTTTTTGSTTTKSGFRTRGCISNTLECTKNVSDCRMFEHRKVTVIIYSLTFVQQFYPSS